MVCWVQPAQTWPPLGDVRVIDCAKLIAQKANKTRVSKNFFMIIRLKKPPSKVDVNLQKSQLLNIQ